MKTLETELVIIGAGPGGYTAAFYAADLGIKTTLVERYPKLGGVCLNVGCIPSKALLHLAALKDEANAAKAHGLEFSSVKINLEKIREFKQGVINKMTSGLNQLSRMRKVNQLTGKAEFLDANNLFIKNESENSEIRLTFKYALIATGSRPLMPASFLPPLKEGEKYHEKIMDSSDALKLVDIPKKLLVVGGGVIGLEMGSVYASFGSKVTVVEAMNKLAGEADDDLIRPLIKHLKQKFDVIHLGAKVNSVKVKGEKISAQITDKNNKQLTETFDKTLVCVGRKPNTQNIGLEKAGVTLSPQGFIQVNNQLRTNIQNIFAIGDVVGNPMLAHKASREGHIAIEAMLGKKSVFDNLGIPNVIYTEPEVAWVGLTERQAKEKGIDYKKSSFPWTASGRATAMGKSDGLTKILFDPKTQRVLGVGIVGANAGELIAEGGLALEMGAVAEDLTLTIHAHPTLSETLLEAAEDLHSKATHIFSQRNK